MMFFGDIALVTQLVLHDLRYAVVLDANVAETEQLGPQHRTVHLKKICYVLSDGMPHRQLTRGLHCWARESGLYILFRLLCLRGLRMAFCETLEGVGIHIQDQGLDNGPVMTTQVYAHEDWLQVPDLLDQMDRHFCVTPSVLFERVLGWGSPASSSCSI